VLVRLSIIGHAASSIAYVGQRVILAKPSNLGNLKLKRLLFWEVCVQDFYYQTVFPDGRPPVLVALVVRVRPSALTFAYVKRHAAGCQMYIHIKLTHDRNPQQIRTAPSLRGNPGEA
jgi:hypothetical protein